MNDKIIGNEKNIIFYNDEDGNTKIDVLLENENVLLNTEALAMLFDIDRSGIVRHINNIYKDEELSEDGTCANIAHMGNDGKQVYNTKEIIMTNLHSLISNYLRYCHMQKRLDEKTQKAYKIDLEQFCALTFSTATTEITSETIEDYIAKLHQQ